MKLKWKMSSEAICHNAVTLSINFTHVKGFADAKIWRKFIYSKDSGLFSDNHLQINVKLI